MSTVEELRKLLAQATPGPWRVADFYNGGTTIASMRSPHATVSIDADEPADIERVAFRATERNAALIVAAVNALPALLDVAEAARALLENDRPYHDTQGECSEDCDFAALERALAALGAVR